MQNCFGKHFLGPGILLQHDLLDQVFVHCNAVPQPSLQLCWSYSLLQGLLLRPCGSSQHSPFLCRPWSRRLAFRAELVRPRLLGSLEIFAFRNEFVRVVSPLFVCCWRPAARNSKNYDPTHVITDLLRSLRVFRVRLTLRFLHTSSSGLLVTFAGSATNTNVSARSANR